MDRLRPRSAGTDIALLEGAGGLSPLTWEHNMPMAKARVGHKDATAKRAQAARSTQTPVSDWTFLTNHAHVLLCIGREPEVRMRDVAQLVGITERAVQRIVADLEAAGYIERIRHGRRNHYKLRTDLPLRHPIERHQQVSALLALVLGEHERTDREFEA